MSIEITAAIGMVAVAWAYGAMLWKLARAHPVDPRAVEIRTRMNRLDAQQKP